MNEPDVKTHYDRPAPPSVPKPPENPVDTGSQALEEALRSSFLIVKFIMVLLVVIFIFSGVKTVGPQERAIIFRFGKPVGTGPEQLLGPGFHWAFPYPIDEVVKIPIGQIQTVTSSVGWYAVTPEQELAGTEPQAAASLNPAAESYTLTGDGNIIHARATLRYHIKDPLAYEFNFLNTTNIVQNILNNALFYASASSTVDYALLSAGFKEKVLARVNQQIDELKLGITLEPSDVKVIVPRYVKPAFDEVLAAQAEHSTTISKARGDADATLGKAQSEANALTNAGEAERIRTVQAVQAEARSFTNQLPQYRVNPELFRQRLLTETWQRILTTTPTNAQDKIFLPDRADGKPRELRILLNREPKNPKTNEPPQP